MKNIILKLKTGNLYKYSKTNAPAVNITIVSLTDITDKIIPGYFLISTYPIKGVKFYDYLD